MLLSGTSVQLLFTKQHFAVWRLPITDSLVCELLIQLAVQIQSITVVSSIQFWLALSIKWKLIFVEFSLEAQISIFKCFCYSSVRLFVYWQRHMIGR